VLTGQGIVPERYDALADVMPLDDLKNRLAQMRNMIRQAAESAPSHREFIERICPAASAA